jgi:hypothetical protein
MSKASTAIRQIVGQFRHDMVRHHSVFFLVYSRPDAVSGEIGVTVTSNSTGDGVGSFLAPMLEPKKEAVEMLIKVLPRPGWFASRAKREKQARDLLDKLRYQFTLAQLDAKPVEPVVEKKIIV